MQQQQRHHVVHCHCLAAFINCTHSIRIAIAGEPYERSCSKHPLFQWLEVAIDWLGVYSAKEWFTIRADSFDLECSSGQKAFNPVAARTMHRIDYYFSRSASQALDINVRRDLLAIALNCRLEQFMSVCRDLGALWRIRIYESLNRGGCIRRCASTPGGFDLETVEVRRIMRCGNYQAANSA